MRTLVWALQIESMVLHVDASLETEDFLSFFMKDETQLHLQDTSL